MPPVDAPTIADVRAARERLAGLVVRTPLVRLAVDEAPAEIHLKLECLQPIGSFKIRGATNAMALAGPERLRDGVYTASAGNMAQGVAWSARRLGVAATAVVPEHAPQAKLSALARLGARVEKVPFDSWWQLLVDRGQPGRKELFIHPVSDLAVMAGNGTIGLEILEDLPDVETIVVPIGGGGLISGVATAAHGHARVVGVEPELSTAMHSALEAGERVDVTPTSIADGLNAPYAGRNALEIVRERVDEVVLVSEEEIEDGFRFLYERAKLACEPAGAAAVAAVLAGKVEPARTVCIVSGGNVAAQTAAAILARR